MTTPDDAPRSQTKVAFRRTETWTSGWRGKQSSTDVLLNDSPVGVINGEEMAAIAGAMSYTLRLWQSDKPAVHEEHDSMRAAKARARALLDS